LAELFLRKLVLAYVLLGVCIFSVQMVMEHRSHRQKLLDDMQTLGSTFVPVAAAALWDFQEGTLESMVSGIGQQSDVVSVEIRGAKGSLNFEWHSPDGAKASDDLRVELPLSLTDRTGQSATVGTLIIASSDEKLWGRLRAVVVSLAVLGSALMLSMGIVVWWLVNRLLVKPLIEFSDQVGKLEGASAEQTIQLGQTHVTEIATLEAGFNRLMRQVGEDQKRIAEQNTNLEQKVAERTHALEAANKAKGEFLARMSHEIRTPMNAVIGLSQLTLRTDLDARQRDYLQKVLAAAQALLGIINDILDFSKIEAGKLTLEHIDLDLQSVLNGVVDVVGLRADEKGLALHTSLAPDVPRYLMGDPTRLGQVLLNLVGNAIKFTAEGSVEVSVAVAAPLGSQVRLLFTVRDSGIGLSEADIATLFQPFHQTDGSVTRRFGGTGLGLAITKQLVELMDGRVWVESAPGQGSRFMFELGFDIAATPPVVPDRRQRLAPANPGLRKTDVIRGARVLLVEDNAINQLVARNFLELDGVVVDIANNGVIGVQKALTGQYALVLMDIQMPEMDGLEATRTIRATPGFETLPIVAMTANAMASDRQSSLDAGMNDHITKPIDKKLLSQTLLQWIKPSDAKPAPDVSATPSAQDTEVTDLPRSAYLDTASGLQNLGGAVPLYLRLLRQFHAGLAEDAAQLRQAVSNGAQQDARRMAHTIKGTAATLGAHAVAARSAELETALVRHEAAGAAQALEALSGAIQNLAADLALIFQTGGAAVQPISDSAGNTAELQHQLKQLGHMLRQSNMRAVDLAAQLDLLTANTRWATRVDSLRAQVDRMDFTAASDSADALLGALQAL
jgi:signal transduction histidine kinase/HPt (histidine-containing phosphotransfer) domain-containing protein/ActR/RegA family two-component response regulator